MSYLKLLLCCTIIITLYGSSKANEEITTKSIETNENATNTLEKVVKDNLTSTRTGRALLHPRIPQFTLRRRQPVKLRSRADHFPLRPQIRRVHNGGLGGMPPQSPQSLRYGYESLKSSKYIPTSKGGNPQFLKGNGLTSASSYRQQLLGGGGGGIGGGILGHPNSVHVPALSQQYIHNFKASPVFNGNVVVHPGKQQQTPQSPQQTQQDTYPKYVMPPQPQQQPSGSAATPSTQPPPAQLQHQQQQQQQQYTDFKQFPIPDQEQMQKYNKQHEKYLQQQKYLTPRDPLAYYQLQQQQQQQLLAQPQQPQNYIVQQPQYFPQKPTTQQLQQQQLQQQPPSSIPIHEITAAGSASAAAADIPNHIAFPSAATPAQKMYSVYEENDMTELQNNDYQTAAYSTMDKEAQEYLKFMNTNEYFLPKTDPNYKLIDEENDRREYSQLKNQQQLKLQQQQYANSFYQQPQQPQQQQQQQTAYQQSQQFVQQQKQQTLYEQLQQQQQQREQPSQPTIYQQSQPQSQHLPSQQYLNNNRHPDSSASSSYQNPIKVSKLFFNYNEEEAAEENPNSSASSSSSVLPGTTVVKTSYQTGYNQNQFVVNSQDNKILKYHHQAAAASPLNGIVLVSTQTPPSQNNGGYSQIRQNSQSSRTPEPLRFEFTERDAMIGGVSYTHAPQGHLRYKAVDNSQVTPKLPTLESSTPSTTISTTLRAQQTYQRHNHVDVKSQLEEDTDDPEDGDDMDEAGTSLYGRQPVASKNSNNNSPQQQQPETNTTENPPSEQKDTEEYCERICAIVEDENEEIVCGSDGYMYTSEAQMECYASCLHIDVTIQGKGSCSAR